MKPIFFAVPADFGKWLAKHHDTRTELIVGYYKVKSGKPSMTWSESVDEALCFGWIDGIRRSIDEESYCIRFTPRKPSSNWSAVNIDKVAVLTKEGRMKPAGIAAFARRLEKKSRIYSYEKTPEKLTPALEKKFKSHKAAWAFFCEQSAYYQKKIIYWVMSGKRETTRLSRLSKLIEASAISQRLF